MTEAIKRCRTCRHWLPHETPAWAWVVMDMAVCALKNTKAVTMAHWSTCPKHDRAELSEIARRVADFKARGVAGTPSRFSQPGEPCG